MQTTNENTKKHGIKQNKQYQFQVTAATRAQHPNTFGCSEDKTENARKRKDTSTLADWHAMVDLATALPINARKVPRVYVRGVPLVSERHVSL